VFQPITAYAELCRIFAGLSSGSSIFRLAGSKPLYQHLFRGGGIGLYGVAG
jgi:hypothetical protein